MTPPTPRPKLRKTWNVDYFVIVAPSLTLAKTVPKTYQTDTWGLFYSYVGHICRLSLTEGGGLIFSIFSQIQITEIWPWFLWYMGLILLRYMQHLVHIWPTYEWYSPHVSVWYDLDTVLARVRGGLTISKKSIFQFFPNFGQGGGVWSRIFPKFGTFFYMAPLIQFV